MSKLDLETLINFKKNINSINLNDMKEIMGINNLKPIDGEDSIKRIVEEDGDYFDEMYEENIKIRFANFLDKAIKLHNN